MIYLLGVDHCLTAGLFMLLLNALIGRIVYLEEGTSLILYIGLDRQTLIYSHLYFLITVL